MSDLSFKTERIGLEYKSRHLNPHLRAVLLELADFLRRQHDIRLVVTCLWRSEEENRMVGGAPKSSHLTWRAADVRTYDWPAPVKQIAVQHLTKLWPRDMLFVKVHDSGTGEHMHLNINYGWAENHKHS